MIQPAQLDQILLAACTGRTPVQLRPIGQDGRCEAILYQLTNDHLVLQTREPHELRNLALCVGTMHFAGKVRTFTTNILQMERSRREKGAWLIWMVRPTQMLSSDGRLAYRVNVVPSAGVKAKVKRPLGDGWEFTLCEVSSTGALLRWTEASRGQAGVRPLCELEQVHLEVKYGRTTVELPAQVRSCEGGRVALCFPDATKRGHVQPEPGWANLVVALERMWLRERASLSELRAANSNETDLAAGM